MTNAITDDGKILWAGPEGRHIVGMIWVDQDHEHLLVAMDDGSVFKVDTDTGASEQVTKARVH